MDNAKFNEYYSCRPIERKGALFNLTLSDRSDGKTFNIADAALEDHLASGDITVHLRRFKPELPQSYYMHFMDDLFDKKPELDKYRDKIRHTKDAVLFYNDAKSEWEPMIFHKALTMAGKTKSTWQPYIQRIHKIKFDEYVPLDRMYARGEMHLLLELWKSVDRDRDTTQLFCFGNAIDLYCPFIDYFDLPAINTDKRRIKTYRDGTIAVEMYFSKEHREKRAESRFSRLVAGTDYAGYNAGGVLRQYGLIECVIDKKAMDYLGAFETPEGSGTLWQSPSGAFCVSVKEQRKDGIKIVNTVGADKRDVSVRDTRIAAALRRARNANEIEFESLAAFHAFEPLLRAVNIK